MKNENNFLTVKATDEECISFTKDDRRHLIKETKKVVMEYIQCLH